MSLSREDIRHLGDEFECRLRRVFSQVFPDVVDSHLPSSSGDPPTEQILTSVSLREKLRDQTVGA